MDIVSLSQKRYTAKVYDKTKKISKENLEQICKFLQNCPSSVNLQPWHFFIIGSEESKNKILPGIMELNHSKITDSSHTIIIASRVDCSSEYLQKVLDQEEKDGRVSTKEQKENMNGAREYFVNLKRKDPGILRWNEEQGYIALGFLLFGVAALGIDASPLEGIYSDKLDEILKLKEKGYTSILAVTLGYHSNKDYNASLPKSRLSQEDIFTHL